MLTAAWFLLTATDGLCVREIRKRASADGTRVFFYSNEPLVAADTDNQVDIYERSGGKTMLVSQGESNGNGSFDSDFDGASADGTRVFFSTGEQLVAADTDDNTTSTSAQGEKRHWSRRARSTATRVHIRFEGASADGTRVFFSTDEQLVAADTDNVRISTSARGKRQHWSRRARSTETGGLLRLRRRLGRRHPGLFFDQRATRRIRYRRTSRHLPALRGYNYARLAGRKQ